MILKPRLNNATERGLSNSKIKIVSVLKIWVKKIKRWVKSKLKLMKLRFTQWEWELLAQPV